MGLFSSFGKALSQLDPTRKGSLVGATVRKVAPMFGPTGTMLTGGLDTVGAMGKALKSKNTGGIPPYTTGAGAAGVMVGPAATPLASAGGLAVPWYRKGAVLLALGGAALLALLLFMRRK